MKAKTDWKIIRGLADWVLTLGLEENTHKEYKRGKKSITVYIDDNFVVIKNADYEVYIHNANFSINNMDIGVMHQNISDYIDELKQFNARVFSTSVRNILRVPLKQRKEQAEQVRLSKIAQLEDKISELKGENANE